MRIPPMPTSLWVAGAVLIMFLGCIRALRFQSLLANAVPAPGSVKRMVAREAASMNLRSVPEAFFVKRRISPMIWCGRRIRLILPSSLWLQLDATGRRAVVLHELAHVRRRDHWVSRVELLIGAIYWWYPLVWWVRGRLHAEAEKCCDAWVTTLLPGDRRAYAEALLRTKQYVRDNRHGVPILGIGMTNGRAERFARRLKMVMTKSVRPGLSLPGTALVMLVATTAWLVTPAQSCPDESKTAPIVMVGPSKTVPTVAVAPCATVSTVAIAPCVASALFIKVLAGCERCRAGKPCTDCKKITKGCPKCQTGELCKNCSKAASSYCCKACKSGDCCGSSFSKLGIGSVGLNCSKCKSGSPCGGCSKVLGFSGKGLLGTYQTYMAGKNAGKAYSDGRAAYQYALGVPQPIRMQMIGSGDRDLEKRIERLEGRLERLGEQLERIADRLTDGDGKQKKKPRKIREARSARASREPREPRRPRAPRPPRPPMPPRPDVAFGPDGGGETIIRSYDLPQGKLEALTELMARPDIPVLIRPGDGAIEVHGTARQHRVFKAFIGIIHPTGKSEDAESRSWRAPNLFSVPDAFAKPERRAWSSERARARGLSQAAREAQHAGRLAELEVISALQAKHAAQGIASARNRMVARLQERQNVLQRIQLERQVLQEQFRQMEQNGDQLRDRAEEMIEAAERLREEADRLRDEADRLRSDADDEDGNDERKTLLVRAEELLAHATSLDHEAMGHDSERNRIDQQAAEADDQASRLDEQAEAMEARLADLEIQALEAREAAEEAEQSRETDG